MKPEAVPKQLKEIRERAKLTRSELAQLLGASLVAIDQWERGINEPSRKQKQNINEILSDISKGRMIHLPPVVLQNGSFASRGSQRRDLHSAQLDMFTEAAEIEIAPSPLVPILSRLKSGIFSAMARGCFRRFSKSIRHQHKL